MFLKPLLQVVEEVFPRLLRSAGGPPQPAVEGAAPARALCAAPTYRATADHANMQPALRHAANGHAEQAFVFHAGRAPWHAAAGLRCDR